MEASQSSASKLPQWKGPFPSFGGIENAGNTAQLESVKLEVKFNWHETPKLFRKWIMQIGRPKAHPKSQYIAESLGDSCMERSLKGSRGVSRLPGQGRSEVRLPHGNVEAHVQGFHLVGHRVNRTLGGRSQMGLQLSLSQVITCYFLLFSSLFGNHETGAVPDLQVRCEGCRSYCFNLKHARGHP